MIVVQAGNVARCLTAAKTFTVLWEGTTNFFTPTFSTAHDHGSTPSSPQELHEEPYGSGGRAAGTALASTHQPAVYSLWHSHTVTRCPPTSLPHPSRARSLHTSACTPQVHTQQAQASDGSEQHSTSSQSRTRPGDQQKQLRQALLEAGLANVGQYGWTATALEAAARQLGLSPAVSGMLPRREAHLVELFISQCNAQLRQQLEEARAAGQLEGLKVTQQVTLALRLRLSMLAPHIDTWPQALAVMTQPANLPHGLSLLQQMVDDVWLAVGDTSTDSSWYTKRGLLAGVYTATELYMLTDYSPGFEDTWQALDRRLQDVMVLGKWARQVGRAAQDAWQQAARTSRSAAQAAAGQAAGAAGRTAAQAAGGSSPGAQEAAGAAAQQAAAAAAAGQAATASQSQ